ncbi:MAG: pimeloyl-ACP methyl ester carboxylesterase/acyl carrier protein [Myxococcota bacterium]
MQPTNNQSEARIAALIQFVSTELLDGEDEAIDAKTPLLAWGIIDSMSMMSMLAFIAEDFGIQIPDEEVRPEHFATLDDLATLLDRMAVDDSDASPIDTVIAGLQRHGLVARELSLTSGGTVGLIESRGAGPTWLLLAGPGQPAVVWTPFMRSKLGQQAMVALDLPGTGSSAEPSGDWAAAWTGAVDDVMLEIEGDVVIFAASSTGVLATRAASSNPERVKAIVLCGFGIDADLTAVLAPQIQLAETPGAYLQGATFSGADLSPALHECFLEATTDPRFQRALTSSTDLRTDEVVGVPTPTLLVHGQCDPFVTQGQADRLADRLNAQRAPLPRCGHLVHLERPQELLHIAERFLASNTNSSRA